jgi:hypothetical protein
VVHLAPPALVSMKSKIDLKSKRRVPLIWPGSRMETLRMRLSLASS